MSETTVIRGGNVLLPNGGLPVCDVLFADGIICEIGSGFSAAKQIDAAGCYVLPGLIDLHTHGIGEMLIDVADLSEYARLEARNCATTFIPTLFAPAHKLVQIMQRLRCETNELTDVPQVAGFRLESPYIADVGGGLRSRLAAITEETTQMLLNAGGEHIRIWDISPELPGAIDLIRNLSNRGIVCSIGHTKCTIEQARSAVESGASLVTHLFDTFYQPRMKDPGVYPVGLVDYLLTEDRVVCEIIADGTHVDPLLVEITLRCKTTERTAFITDSYLGAGLAPGEYFLPNDQGRVLVNGPNDGVRLIDQELCLTGSALTPIAAFRNAVRVFGQDIAAASRLCSTTPARVLGLNKGELAPGRDADLMVLNANLDPMAVVAQGKLVW